MVAPAPHGGPVLVEYRDAIAAWVKKAERDRMVISHVRFERDGHIEVTMIPRKEAQKAAAQETLL